MKTLLPKTPDTLRVRDAIGNMGSRPLIVEGTSAQIIHDLMMNDWPQRVEDKSEYMTRVAHCCGAWQGKKEPIRVHSGPRAFVNDLIRSGFLVLLAVNGKLTPAGRAEALMERYRADTRVQAMIDPDMDPEAEDNPF